MRVQDCNIGQSAWPQQQSSIVSVIDISESLNITSFVAAAVDEDDAMEVVVVVVVANMLVLVVELNRLQRSMIRAHQEAWGHG